LGIHGFIKSLLELWSELGPSIRHNLLRYTMQTNYPWHIQLCQLRSGVGCLDGYKMSYIGQSIHNYPPQHRLLHGLGSKSAGTRNAPFHHLPCGVAWPRLDVQHRGSLLQMPTSEQQLRSLGRYDWLLTSRTGPLVHAKGRCSLAATSRFRWNVAALRIPTTEVVSIETLKNSQWTDHRCETTWAWRSNAVRVNMLMGCELPHHLEKRRTARVNKHKNLICKSEARMRD
jgi:hypothetical protein